MRPSISVTLEPGLERGVPWGRDLYTFVTSAAGHMMRTLQKPRKNRPSKRQVNHRRFLHNMIQRKFADIEAANHRLASALYMKKVEEENVSSLSSQKLGTPDQSDGPSPAGCLHDADHCNTHTDVDDISKSDIIIASNETEIGEKKQPDSGNLWHPKLPSTTCISRKNKQGKGTERQKKGHSNHKLVGVTSLSSPKDFNKNHWEEHFQSKYSENENPPKPTTDHLEETETLHGSSSIQRVETSPSFTPDLSPLSLNSSDFALQVFTESSSCVQAQKSISDIAESQWADIMDLFSVGSKDLGGCIDVEAYFESICACQGDAGGEDFADEDAFADPTGHFTERIRSNRSEEEELHCERGEHIYDYGYSCQGDQALTNHFQSYQRSTIEDTAEQKFNYFRPSQCTDIIPDQLPASISSIYNVSELQTYQHPQEEGSCMLLNNQNFTPFEGVAQSFSAPPHDPEHRPIPTPPQEEDWLFTDILKDRKSLYC